MSNKITSELRSIWADVDNRVWDAPAKYRYRNGTYQELLDKAEKVQENSNKLESYSTECISRCNC